MKRPSTQKAPSTRKPSVKVSSPTLEKEPDEDQADAGEDDEDAPADLVAGDANETIDHNLDLVVPGQDKGLVTTRDPVHRFVQEARRFARLSEEEEKDLGRKARTQNDLEAAKTLVVHNLRLVVAIAYQYRQAWLNMLDLFQEGSVGLMEAVRRWDPEVGTRFGSYAAYWIRAYILRFLMTNARLIHVGNTRAGRKLFFRLERERQKLLAAGFDPTPKLLAAKLDVDEADIIEVSTHLASREVSLEPRPDEEGVPLSERIRKREANPEENAARNELSQSIRGLMIRFAKGLSDDREKAIWAEHLANDGEPASLSDLGARFGVSKQRMGQIADKIKKQFREEVLAELGAEIQMAWQPEDTDG